MIFICCYNNYILLQYKSFVIAIERLLKHPCSYKAAEFISEYQKPMISTKAITESSPVIINILLTNVFLLK